MWENFKTLQHIAFSLPPLQTLMHTLQFTRYPNPVPVMPQLQGKSCKGKTKAPWNTSTRNAVAGSSLLLCLPGLFLFRAFRSSPLWIREPGNCLNIPPQLKTALLFFFPSREDLHLRVHRDSTAMSDLLISRLSLQEKHPCWMVWFRTPCSVVTSGFKMQTTLLAKPKPVSV